MLVPLVAGRSIVRCLRLPRLPGRLAPLYGRCRLGTALDGRLGRDRDRSRDRVRLPDGRRDLLLLARYRVLLLLAVDRLVILRLVTLVMLDLIVPLVLDRRADLGRSVVDLVVMPLLLAIALLVNVAVLVFAALVSTVTAISNVANPFTCVLYWSTKLVSGLPTYPTIRLLSTVSR